ncbi:hypothetical protein JHK87_006853 [Glycine soja]|nr:hypothetical protein JHK87_006853 [Glycine soja]KAG5071807.1 hypothetical protein JHK86_007018 [Glycine max]
MGRCWGVGVGDWGDNTRSCPTSLPCLLTATLTLEVCSKDNQSVHVLMELCAGGELFDRIIAKGHYSERATASICSQVVKLVNTCHFMGVIHGISSQRISCYLVRMIRDFSRP